MSLKHINASNGSGEAVLATVTSIRTAGASTVNVDATTNWPAFFIATSGKKLSDNTLDPTSLLVYYGHKSGSTAIIDTIAPGYTDHGNSVGDVVIVKPSTEWANNLAALLGVSLNDDGTIKSNLITTAMLQDAAVTPVKATNPYKFRARLTSGTNTTGSVVYAKVPFNTEDFDTNNNFDITTNPGRYTAPVAGFYNFSSTVAITTGGRLAIALYKNGTVYSYGDENFAGIGNANPSANINDDIQLAANDYIEIYALGDTARTIDTTRTRFSGKLTSKT